VMLTKDGPQVLEFNCRLGEPETQAIVARMNFDLAEVLLDVASNRLVPSKLKWKSGASACVVLASGGYPGPFEDGKTISGLQQAAKVPGVVVFHAGTKTNGNEIVTGGGRVLGVTANAPSLEEALRRAYEAAGRIAFAGAHYRKDIGAHAGARAAGD
jgi:phosphoribosylamine--glycine ligase